MKKVFHMTNKEAASHLIIVIGRQFGCGARQVGKRLSEKLGIAYYDKELMTEAAESLGFSREIFANADERRPSAFKAMLQAVYGVANSSAISNPMSGESIYAMQSEMIRRLADKSSCVIVGRTADYVLRNHPRCVSIFLHGNIDRRADIILKRGDASTIEEAREMARSQDKNRESYYNYFTGRHWGRCDNYHLSVDATLFSVDTLAEFLATYVDLRNKAVGF